MNSIYQHLWNADQAGNGLPALRIGETKDPTIGYVLVDEPAGFVGDNHQVLKEVNIPDHKKQTYKLCERLFDNYALERAAGERVRPVETQEQLDFIDAIVNTPTIQLARRYLGESLGLRISDQNLVAMINETWFDMGVSGRQRRASGFEHVFVGEQGSTTNSMSGYHFWYKYYLDDGNRGQIGDADRDRIQYNGTRYGGAIQPDKGILVPEVVTLSMVVDASLGDRSSRRGTNNDDSKKMTKAIGGFFVGCSPECMIALGLVRCRTQSGKIATINGAEYQLDLHRLDNKPNAIRTFFPRFRRADIVEIEPPRTTPDSTEKPVPSDPAAAEPEQASSIFRIVAAMVNPTNPEGGREFVQIINLHDAVSSLGKWKVVAPNGTRFTLANIAVEPGHVYRFQFPGNQGTLRNKAGSILLENDLGDVVQTCVYSDEDASQEGAPILFNQVTPNYSG